MLREPRAARRAGFTLIELLIVVAIIAILAAIAVPNFLEAQTRSKISRTKNDLRTMATALEAYFVDYNSYTKDSDSSLDLAEHSDSCDPTSPDFALSANGALYLTTPVAYLTSLLQDPFGGAVTVAGGGAIGYRIGSGSWSYEDDSFSTGDNQSSAATFAITGPVHAYVLIGVGPDALRCRVGYKNFPFMTTTNPKEGPPGENVNSKGMPFNYTDYDPTNGTTSVGDVYRFGGAYREGRFMQNGADVGRESSPGAGVY